MAPAFGQGTNSTLVVRIDVQVSVVETQLLKSVNEKFDSDSFKPTDVMPWNFPVWLKLESSPGSIDNNSNAPRSRSINVDAKILNFTMRGKSPGDVIMLEGSKPELEIREHHRRWVTHNIFVILERSHEVG